MLSNYNQYILSLNESVSKLTKTELDFYDDANAELKEIMTKHNGMKNIPSDIISELKMKFKDIPEITSKINSAKRKLKADFTNKFENEIKVEDVVYDKQIQRYGNSNKVHLVLLTNGDDEAILIYLPDRGTVILKVNGKEIAENYKFTKPEIIQAAKELYLRTKASL